MTTYNLLETNPDQRPDTGWLHGVITAWGPDGGPYRLASLTDPFPVELHSVGGVIIQQAGVANDTTTSNFNGLFANAFAMLYDAANNQWVRRRPNQLTTLLASAVRSAQTQSANQTNYNGKGVQLSLNVTAASGTGGLAVRFIGVDSLGSQYFMNVQPPLITAIGTYVYELYPGASTAPPAVANSIQQRIAGSLPQTWAGRVEVGDASNYTYSLSASVIL